MATTDGVVRAPSAFSMTLGFLPSMTATHEFVVPRSMPMILLMGVFDTPLRRTDRRPVWSAPRSPVPLKGSFLRKPTTPLGAVPLPWRRIWGSAGPPQGEHPYGKRGFRDGLSPSGVRRQAGADSFRERRA